jgi:hypothetical protein
LPNGFWKVDHSSSGRPYGRKPANRRIALAQRPIYGSHQPLSYIAATCGFVDQSHLTRVFRRSPFVLDIDAVWVLLECTKWRDEVERPSIQRNRDHGS